MIDPSELLRWQITGGGGEAGGYGDAGKGYVDEDGGRD
jgi:hypothetical protein